MHKDSRNPSAGQLEAIVHATLEFVDIAACAKYGLSIADRSLCWFQLSEPVRDEDLGISVGECLAKSTTPSPEVFRLARAGVSGNYERWVRETMSKFGLDRRKLFIRMQSVSAICIGGIITFEPSHHHKLESWSGDGLTDADHVHIPITRPAYEIGAALRLALSRCS
jgi:hypothetical protein